MFWHNPMSYLTREELEEYNDLSDEVAEAIAHKDLTDVQYFAGRVRKLLDIGVNRRLTLEGAGL